MTYEALTPFRLGQTARRAGDWESWLHALVPFEQLEIEDVVRGEDSTVTLRVVPRAEPVAEFERLVKAHSAEVSDDDGWAVRATWFSDQLPRRPLSCELSSPQAN